MQSPSSDIEDYPKENDSTTYVESQVNRLGLGGMLGVVPFDLLVFQALAVHSFYFIFFLLIYFAEKFQLHLSSSTSQLRFIDGVITFDHCQIISFWISGFMHHCSIFVHLG